MAESPTPTEITANERPVLPGRFESGHKGDFGTVIVVGGSDGMPGAAALSARSAFRAGAGLVKVAATASVLSQVLVIEPSATGIAIGDREAEVTAAVEAIEGSDPEKRAVLAVGPGMGVSEARLSLVRRLLMSGRAVVLDADGLNCLARLGVEGRDMIGDGSETRRLVMTPHPGEYRRLAEAAGIACDPVDPETRAAAARQLAVAYGAVVILKGNRTVVSDRDGERVAINTTGNPAMATAGSGDVLTGLIAALIGQKMGVFEAACLGVYLHGVAGDRWAGKFGRSGMLARELADELPGAFEASR